MTTKPTHTPILASCICGCGRPIRIEPWWMGGHRILALNYCDAFRQYAAIARSEGR